MIKAPGYSKELAPDLVTLLIKEKLTLIGTTENATAAATTIKKGSLAVRGTDGKFSTFDIATAADVTAFVTTNAPYAIIGVVVSEDVSVPAKSGDTNGSATISVLLKGKVNKALLYSGAALLSSLTAVQQAKVENMLIDADIYPLSVAK